MDDHKIEPSDTHQSGTDVTESTYTSSKPQWDVLKDKARLMRQNDTQAEERLWEALRNRRLCNAKFRRQHAIDRFVVDFFCVQYGLIIEVDGSIHEETKERDKERQDILEDKGYTVLRFTNEDVLSKLPDVLHVISAHLQCK